MINVFSDATRHSADLGWLRSRPSFSFGGYQDPNRTGFSVLRVCNDDYLDPGKGFGAHPHSDMEIVSIVLNGLIRHEDNMGNSVVTSFGEVQRMSAGSGVIHTEFNASETEELRLLQLWFMPKERGLAPSYEAVKFDTNKLHNALLPVVSDRELEQVASIGQDMTIYLSKLERGKQLQYEVKSGRRQFLFIIEGQLQVHGETLAAGDTAQIEAVEELAFTAKEPAFFMLIDLP
jgi:redox-sensitive bicupin YhaK (pirin superfamily)